MKTLMACIIWSLVAGAAHAKLKFEAEVLERSAKIGDASVLAEFKFTNNGKKAVEIGLIDSTCGCLKAESDKRRYEPGESGVVEAEFFVKGLSGLVEKAIFVHAKGDKSEAVRLAVRVSIPEILSIEPKMASWDLNESVKSKRVVFKVLRPEPIRVLEVVPSRRNVTAELHVIEEGRHYEIELTPTETGATMLGVVRIETDCEIREQQRQMAFFRIAKNDD
ncbi:MAG: DUF1573 domain-containing protein [Verrucomicrobiota bacterium]